ncbi:hypothetical protein [Sphingobium sp. YG1]|uniref:hypothetical protein n=1 Tax=Sphingobium sp. YG1 TaxID=2082188 RepID=UPI000E72C9D0|nr:hypothetical protein [Sphingobium sp. YG1]|tara:strand:- start:877 stop:1362 length:486 start_codon:yes stop_codon:yes gene_type:complete
MSDRVSAHIMIGGIIPRSQYPDFVRAIAHDNPAIDWDGTPFDSTYLPATGPLTLMDHEVANGCFEKIEESCRRLGLHYVRWADGFGGSFPSVRVIYRGHGEPQNFLTTQDDQQIFSIERIRELGSIAAIEAEYRLARMNPPPLVLVDKEPTDEAMTETVHG